MLQQEYGATYEQAYDQSQPPVNDLMPVHDDEVDFNNYPIMQGQPSIQGPAEEARR